jgi:hypothetical protein
VRRHRNKGSSYQFGGPHHSPLDDSPPRRDASRPTLTPLDGSGIADIHSYRALSYSGENRSRKKTNNYGPLDSYEFASPNSARQRTTDVRSSPPGSSIPLRTTNRNSISSVSSPTNANPPPSSASNPGAVHEVFVVHHDAGAPPPVTVYALPGSRVTELPPGYDFGRRSPENSARGSQQQPAPLGEHPSPGSPPVFSRRDQKAAYTPRSGPPPTTTYSPPTTPYSPPTTPFSPPPEPLSPQISAPDERGRTVTPTRLLPSTQHLHPPTQ